MVSLMGVEVLTTVAELADPDHCAVLVIDVQNGIVHPEAGLRPESLAAAAIPCIQRLLAAARQKGVLVTYAEYVHRDARGNYLVDGPNLFCHRKKTSTTDLREGAQEARTIDALAPQPGDLVIPKHRASAFADTPLDAFLKQRGIRSVLITGTSTRGCVLMTAVDTQMHGYYPVVLRDCVFTGSQQAQDIALTWMESEMAVCTSDEVLASWQPGT